MLKHNEPYVPLAERLRPKTLSEVVGQDHILNKDGALAQKHQLTSMILWGPPGSGKTTLARLLAENSNMRFQTVSATLTNLSELRNIFAAAEAAKRHAEDTCLFVDEIHRFNKNQQDAFLPYVENGSVILIGATTENPGFELNAALLSRCRVLVLRRLDNAACDILLQRAEAFMGAPLPLEAEARSQIIAMCDGDGRYLLNLVESLYAAAPSEPLDNRQLTEFLQKRAPIYDKSDDSHYNLISALHKSLRASDCDAALYWLHRMLDGGEDPHYILRRLFRFAYEDIGLADPQAPVQALTAWQYYERLGSPEGELACAYLVAYLATAPKSNAVYKAQKLATGAAKKNGSLMPPKHILNAPIEFMKQQGYGKDYQYDHDSAEAFSGQNCFPESMPRERYYQPNPRGFEREIIKRLDYWQSLRAKKQNKD